MGLPYFFSPAPCSHSCAISSPQNRFPRHRQQVVIEAHVHILHGPLDGKLFPVDVSLKRNTKAITWDHGDDGRENQPVTLVTQQQSFRLVVV